MLRSVVTSESMCDHKPSVIVWDPLNARDLGNLTITCPVCEGTLISTATWTNGSSSRLNPRYLYDIQGKALLLSQIYKCEKCKQTLLAHDARILTMFPESLSVPFILLHKCGFTRSLIDLTN